MPTEPAAPAVVCNGHGCQRPPKNRGLCSRCYQRWRKAQQTDWDARLAAAQARIGGADGALERLEAIQALHDLQARVAAIPVPVERPVPDPVAHDCGRHPAPSAACAKVCKCGCDGCRSNYKLQRHRHEQAAAAGRSPWADPATVRAHLQALAAAGMGRRQISRATNVSESAIAKITHPDGPRQARVRREVAERLLACRPTPADGAHIPVGPTLGKVEELVGAGFSRGELARYLTGNPAEWRLNITLAGRQMVTVRIATAVDRLWADWKAGRVVPRGKMPPNWHGPHSHLPRRVTPAAVAVPQANTPGRRGCQDCGAPPLAGGRWCLPCFQSRANPKAPTGCGTDAGYAAHRRAGTDPCQACRDAHANRNLARPSRTRRALAA